MSNMKPLELDESSDGKVVAVPTGTDVVLRLRGNITTGYSWAITSGDAGPVDAKYVSDPNPRRMPGVGGHDIFTWSASKRGATKGDRVVELGYRRPWLKGPPGKTFRVTLRFE